MTHPWYKQSIITKIGNLITKQELLVGTGTGDADNFNLLSSYLQVHVYSRH